MSPTLLGFLTLLASSNAAQDAALPSDSTPIVLHKVAILSPDSAEITKDQSIIVDGDKIAWIGSSNDVVIAEGATVIQGQGRTLLPGLVDMHVHTYTEADFMTFLAHGVTSIRVMSGFRMHLGWRDRIEKGELLGPTIHTAGAILDGDPPIWQQSTVLRTADQARETVQNQDGEGYDFLKVYNNLSPDVYDALVEAASSIGMPVVGHVPDAVGLLRVLASKQRTIEHLSGYERAANRDVGSVDIFEGEFLWSELDLEELEEFVEATAASETWNCPTLIVRKKWINPDELSSWLASEEFKLLSKQARDTYSTMYERSFRHRSKEWFDALERGHEVRGQLVGALHDEGARLIAGTDVGNMFVIPGYSLHEELGLLVDAGLSPNDAITTATLNAADCLDGLDAFGSVAEGLRADLILVDGDPRQDISVLRRLHGVMVRGRWISEQEIDAHLQALKRD